MDGETRPATRVEEAPRAARDDFGWRGVVLLAALAALSVVLAAIDPADAGVADVLDAASLVAGGLFWAALLWLTYAHRPWSRRRAR